RDARFLGGRIDENLFCHSLNLSCRDKEHSKVKGSFLALGEFFLLRISSLRTCRVVNLKLNLSSELLS
ncbi:MAG: hypothetical protein COV44_11765, partial [Deltaproteobacteria bacterium CG11_big_fil_rev_8_21_14_0_20_45_16]